MLLFDLLLLLRKTIQYTIIQDKLTKRDFENNIAKAGKEQPQSQDPELTLLNDVPVPSSNRARTRSELQTSPAVGVAAYGFCYADSRTFQKLLKREEKLF